MTELVDPFLLRRDNVQSLPGRTSHAHGVAREQSSTARNKALTGRRASLPRENGSERAGLAFQAETSPQRCLLFRSRCRKRPLPGRLNPSAYYPQCASGHSVTHDRQYRFVAELVTQVGHSPTPGGYLHGHRREQVNTYRGPRSGSSWRSRTARSRQTKDVFD